MTDVFISYSTEDHVLAEKLAAFLQEKGYSVWWDRHLAGGQDFHEKIRRVLDECRIAIVIWTQSSIHSRWVLGEADTAATAQKLIPVRANALRPEQLPIAFRALHTVALNDRDALLDAIRSRLGAPPKAIGHWEIFKARAMRQCRLLRHRLTLRRVVFAGVLLATVGYIGFNSLEWMRIRDSIEVSDFKRHLETFPASLFASVASAKLAGASEWERVRNSRLPADIETFIEKFPHSVHNEFARLRLSRLQAVAAGRYHHVLADSARRLLRPEELEPLTCDQLWIARNEIFYAVGYCFVTDAGRDHFRTTAECPYSDCRRIQRYNASVNDEILSTIETRNVDSIKKVEQQKGCRMPPVVGLCPRGP